MYSRNRHSNIINKQLHMQHKNKIKKNISQKIVTKYTWNNALGYNSNLHLSYSFTPAITSGLIDKEFFGDVFSFNQSQISQAKKAMQAWSDVADISFSEAPRGLDGNVIFLNFNRNNIGTGYGQYPNSGKISLIKTNYIDSYNRAPGKFNFGAHVLIHEVGHVLGLKHTHDLENSPENQQYTQQVSVMSYQSEQASGANYSDNYLSAPQLYDIAAVQYLYGPNLTTRTGNTAYGFNSNSDRDFLTADTPTDKLIFCVWDAGGIDTFDFSGYTENQNINLNELGFSDVGGLVANISIAADVVIENAIGGSGNDKLVGNDVDNILTGGAGADHLWGDEGNNIFRYNRTSDSTSTSSDTIHDFKSDKDKIDLSPLLFGDRNIAMVNRFSFSGQTEIQQKYDAVRDITYLMVDFDNNVYETDMMIRLIGRHQLTLNNFITSPQLTA